MGLPKYTVLYKLISCYKLLCGVLATGKTNLVWYGTGTVRVERPSVRIRK